MSKIKDIMIDVIEKLESGINPDEIAYYVSYTYEIPYAVEVNEIIEKIRSTMNRTNECIEEFPQVF
jgi:NADP-dependent 3-hydroxy acid dehydrogenase YdfG